MKNINYERTFIFGILFIIKPNKKICVVLVTLPTLVFTPDPKPFFPIFKNQLLAPTLFCLV
jgi:hypothetical protein